MEGSACNDSSPFISLITGLILIEPQRASELLCRTAFKHTTSISVCDGDETVATTAATQNAHCWKSNVTHFGNIVK